MSNLEIKKLISKILVAIKITTSIVSQVSVMILMMEELIFFTVETIPEKVLIRKFFKVLSLSNFQKSMEI